jgi:hypothetical protein
MVNWFLALPTYWMVALSVLGLMLYAGIGILVAAFLKKYCDPDQSDPFYTQSQDYRDRVNIAIVWGWPVAVVIHLVLRLYSILRLISVELPLRAVARISK